MESWEVLYKAIPKNASERVAKFLSVSADLVRKWRREPESDESPLATGQRSILDRMCDLIDVVFLINPNGVALIVNHINSHYRKLMQVHAKPIETMESRVVCTANLLTQATEAINRMNLEGCTEETLNELVELRAAADQAIQDCERTLGRSQEEDAE